VRDASFAFARRTAMLVQMIGESIGQRARAER
jgi:hypothetical protein